MKSLEELASIDEIKREYKKSLLLNILQKLVGRMRHDAAFCSKVKNLYKQSTNRQITTKVIVEQYLNFNLTEEDVDLMTTWMIAHLNKSDRRRVFPHEYKQQLCDKQNGRCMVCGEPFGIDQSKIHVDHIIPWVLVGDELKDNYQCLCETCNESKSCHTDFIFKRLIKLN